MASQNTEKYSQAPNKNIKISYRFEVYSVPSSRRSKWSVTGWMMWHRSPLLSGLLFYIMQRWLDDIYRPILSSSDPKTQFLQLFSQLTGSINTIKIFVSP